MCRLRSFLCLRGSKLTHAYRTVLTDVYARLTLAALVSIYHRMLCSSMWCRFGVVLNETYALHGAFLYTRARSRLFPAFTAVTLLQIYRGGHLFRSPSVSYVIYSLLLVYKIGRISEACKKPVLVNASLISMQHIYIL